MKLGEATTIDVALAVLWFLVAVFAGWIVLLWYLVVQFLRNER